MATYGNQGTLLSEMTFPEFTDLVRREWLNSQNLLERNARQLFITDMIGSGAGSSKRYNEIDIETFADSKPEGTNSTKSKVGVGYQKDMTAATFSKMIDITLEMRNDNRYQEVGSSIVSLVGFCENRADLDLTHRLTFATSTTYTNKNGEPVTTTVGDDNALCDATHDLAFSSETYRNRVAGDPVFSQGSFEAAKLLAASDIYTNFGERRQMNFNTIVSWEDPGTVREIRQLLNSTADVDAAQSGITNVYSGVMNHVILPHLATTATSAYDSAKRRWWFIAAAGQGAAGWQAYYGVWISPQLLTPNDANAGMNIQNLNWSYITYCRYGVVTVTGKGIIGSFPSS